MMLTSLRPLPALLVAGLLLAAPTLAVAPREVERVVDAPSDGVVEITNIAGSVAVTGWDRAEVRVIGTLGPEIETLLVDNQGARTLVAVIVPRFHGSDIDAHIRVWAPRASQVRAEAVSADVAVTDVDGKLEIETVSGLIDVEGEPSSVMVETVNGPIDVEGRPGAVQVETVSGRVEIEAAVDDVHVVSTSGTVMLKEGVHGKIRATSVSGDFVVDGGEFRRAVLETVSGRIRVGGVLAAGGVIQAGSHQGDIELRLPSSTSAAFDLRSLTGEIENGFGPRPRRDRGAMILEFNQGGGSGTVTVFTFSGDVTLDEP